MTPIRVLMITGEYPPHPGGIAGYTRLLREALGEHDVQSIVMSSPDTNADVTLAEWSWRLPSTIQAVIAGNAIDLVHIQYQAGAFNMHLIVNLLPRLIGEVPVVTTFHDLRPPYLFPKAGRARFLVMRRMARWSDAVVVSNPADERVLAEAGIVAMRIPLGPSLPAPRPGIAPGYEVGYFGFPSPQKGFNILVEALSMIDADRRPALLIVGGETQVTGHHAFYSEQDVDALGRFHAVKIRRTGYLEPQAAADVLASCRVLAFPFPGGATRRSSALIAALRMGRPVITTSAARDDLGPLADLPQLVLAPDAHPAAVAGAIDAALYTPRAPLPLPPEHEWDAIARRHRELYRGLKRETNL